MKKIFIKKIKTKIISKNEKKHRRNCKNEKKRRKLLNFTKKILNKTRKNSPIKKASSRNKKSR